MDVNLKLCIAVRDGDISSMEILLLAGASPEVPGSNDISPIVACCLHQQIEAFKLFMSFFPSRVRTWLNMKHKGFNDGTLLLILCAKNNVSIEFVKLLLSYRADVHYSDELEMTALHHACKSKRNSAVVRLLVEAGADVNAKNSSFNTPLQLIFLKKSYSDLDPIIEYLINLSNLEIHDMYGKTALHHAADCGFINSVKLILNKNKNLIHIHTTGQTPLVGSLLYNHPDIATLLLDHKASPVVGCPIMASIKHPDIFERILLLLDGKKLPKILPIACFRPENTMKSFEKLLKIRPHKLSAAIDEEKVIQAIYDYLSYEHEVKVSSEANIEKITVVFSSFMYLKTENCLKHLVSLLKEFEPLGTRHHYEFVDLINHILQMGVPSYDADIVALKQELVELLDTLRMKGEGSLFLATNLEPYEVAFFKSNVTEAEGIQKMELMSRLASNNFLNLKQISRLAVRKNFLLIPNLKDQQNYIKEINIPVTLKNFILYKEL